MDELQHELDVNFLGAVRVCRAVLPSMRARGEGLIVNVTSLAGRVGLPFQGFYCASKFALEGFSESLREEVRPFGIRVTVIEPGNFKTGLTKRRRVGHDLQASAYQPWLSRARQAQAEEERGGGDAAMIGPLLERIMGRADPAVRYPLVSPMERFLPAIERYMPDRVRLWVVRRMMGLQGS